MAGVHSKVQLFKWGVRNSGIRELAHECSHSGHVMVLYLATRGDFILVGKAAINWGDQIVHAWKTICLWESLYSSVWV